MSDQAQATWTEENSETYARLAAIAVPARVEQLATLLTLVPFGPDDEFRAVELGSGQGYLSHALLTAFPRASMMALDGSEAMRRSTAAQLAPFGARVQVEPFDLFETEWRHWLDSADVVLSSLVIHHLDGAGKRELFKDVAERTSARSALLIADLVEAQRPEANDYFGATLERMARQQALAETNSDDIFQLFKSEQWNLYFYPDPDVDKPSPLFQQLAWLAEAGFPIVDCFWMQAGHAIYGGYKISGEAASPSLPYAEALRVAELVLSSD